MSNLKVTVIGAGVVGLSTACAFRQQFPNADVTVVAEDIETGTTSHVAAGYFCPTTERAPTADLTTMGKWAVASGEHYRQLALSADADAAGVGVTGLCELSEQPNARMPFFAPHVFSCWRLTDEELDRLLPSAKSVGILSAFQAVTTYAQGDRYLPYLWQSLRIGGRTTVRQARLTSLSEAFASTNCQLLFNCSGLGAGRLCPDPDVYPSRGQVVRVAAPAQKLALHGPNGQYVLPNRDDLVLGGTAGIGSYDTSVSQADTDAILQRACSILPSLKTARVLCSRVGLRPCRRGGTRLEVEQQQGEAGGPAGIVVHNYGHGANGVALSWGSAVHAVELAREALRASSRRSRL